jgi:hypothetical protein
MFQCKRHNFSRLEALDIFMILRRLHNLELRPYGNTPLIPAYTQHAKARTISMGTLFSKSIEN